MAKIAGVNHLKAVRALEKAGFTIICQGKHIVMSDGTRQVTIPRHNPIKDEGFPMITMQRLVRFVGAEPFRPFRIRMASGQTYDIRHPEMINVGRTTANIYTYMGDDTPASKERELEVSLLLMESVEPLNATTAQDAMQ